MSGERDPSELFLALGQTMGMLMVPELRAALVQALRASTLAPGYVKRIRDDLNDVLDKAGVR